MQFLTIEGRISQNLIIWRHDGEADRALRDVNGRFRWGILAILPCFTSAFLAVASCTIWTDRPLDRSHSRIR